MESISSSAQVNLSTTSAGGTMTSPRPHGPATSATTTALNQSVLLGGNSAGQGQMYLRVSVGGKQMLSLFCSLLGFFFIRQHFHVKIFVLNKRCG